MIFVALSEADRKGELILVDSGMCRWHRRRDGIVVVREILVLQSARRKGIGRAIIEMVKAANPGRRILAKCPKGYESNSFWKCVGFHLVDDEGHNLWQFP